MRATLLFVTAMLAYPVFAQNGVNLRDIRVDAFDADAWNGIVFLAESNGQPISFGLRVGSRNGTFLDGNEIYAAVTEVGPHAPDASYCRVSWHHAPSEARITLEWSRIDANTVVGRLTAATNVQLVLEGYLPRMGGPAEGVFSVNESARMILGERYLDRVFGSTAKLLIVTDRPIVRSGAYGSVDALRASMRASGSLNPTDDPLPAAGGLEFTTDTSRRAHFVAALGIDQPELAARASILLTEGKIEEFLRDRSDAYARKRPKVDGLFAGTPEAIGNTMFWNTLYAPSEHLIFPSISRAWGHNFGGWVVGEWDCFFGALLTSLEDADQTAAGIRGILTAQTDSGVVPNLASGSGGTPDRSQPPVGAYVVWKTHQHLLDRSLLAWAYPRLKKWHEWWLADRGDGQPWRDGNRDGLLEWGSDRGHTETVGGRGSIRQAKWESGMDDSPMYDDAVYDPHTYTLNLNDVGLNSLYALDAECLARLAALQGMDEDSRRFSSEYERMKRLINEKLWNERDGIYENRFWDGKFSARLSPTNFYPLFAGVPGPDQARRMIREHLLNPAEFWGSYVAPTIARNDPAFADQFYWRGDIWGPTNYMLYQGLNRYGFDAEALDYARKSYALFMDDWKTQYHSNENYHAWGGNGGGDTHYTWGTLLCLVALEQYIDENPWDGLRFGSLSPPEAGTLTGAIWEGQRYDIAIGPSRTALTREGKLLFDADSGVVVRHYRSQAFTIKSERTVHVTVAELNAARLELRIDGRPAGPVTAHHGQAVIAIPAGEHHVELVP